MTNLTEHTLDAQPRLDHARVGAGSVVLHDVLPGETVHGAPARPSFAATS